MSLLNLEVILPSDDEWRKGLVQGAIPQLPLTTLNSVVSVCALSVDLFRDAKDGGKGASRVSVATSVGLMNVVGCWFGGMPSCHGAGGLAGQYRFGARGGTSILILGICKILLALSLGQLLDAVIQYYPVTILGVLLLYAGVELATVGAKLIMKSEHLEEDMLPCFVTAGAYIGSKNMALGVSAGIIVAAIQRMDKFREFPGIVMGADANGSAK
jgi:MFS superfamily sulfate permease-like transporter